jgi:hypothetical protein
LEEDQMATRQHPQVVTIDEGDGPVKVVKDPGGRVITKEQVTKIRQKQQADLEKVAELRDNLQAGDAEAVAEVTGQVKDRVAKRLVLLAGQHGKLQEQRSKLDAGDAATTDEVVGRMIHRLSRRIERLTEAQGRLDTLLAEL